MTYLIYFLGYLISIQVISNEAKIYACVNMYKVAITLTNKNMYMSAYSNFHFYIIITTNIASVNKHQSQFHLIF